MDHPDSGKTSLSKKLFLEAKATNRLPSKAELFAVNFSTLLDPELGQSSRNIDRLFDFISTRKFPCFLIMDELDAICMTRENTNEHDGVRRSMTTLMLCLDRIRASRKVMVFGITNMLRLIDAAVVRRFFFRLEISPVLTFQEFCEYARHLLGSDEIDEAFKPAYDIFLGKKFCAGDLRGVAAQALVRASIDAQPALRGAVGNQPWRGTIDL